VIDGTQTYNVHKLPAKLLGYLPDFVTVFEILLHFLNLFFFPFSLQKIYLQGTNKRKNIVTECHTRTKRMIRNNVLLYRKI
jgi:hypothetical protein